MTRSMWAGSSYRRASMSAAFERAVSTDASVVRIGAGRDRAGRDAVLHDATDQPVPERHRRAGAVAELGVRVVGLDRGVHDRAAARDHRACGPRWRRSGPCACSRWIASCSRFCERGETVGDERHRVVVGLERELLLGAEVVVDAALLEAGRVDEVAHRGADVAPLVEDRRRQLDDPLAGGGTLRRARGSITGSSRPEKTDRSV